MNSEWTLGSNLWIPIKYRFDSAQFIGHNGAAMQIVLLFPAFSRPSQLWFHPDKTASINRAPLLGHQNCLRKKAPSPRPLLGVEGHRSDLGITPITPFWTFFPLRLPTVSLRAFPSFLLASLSHSPLIPQAQVPSDPRTAH